MDLRDEDGDEIPLRFQSWEDRRGLEYRQTPAGAALYFGLGALFLGGLFLTGWEEVPGDRGFGIGLVVLGVLLLVLWLVLHRLRQRREDALYAEYRRWKQERAASAEDGEPDQRRS